MRLYEVTHLINSKAADRQVVFMTRLLQCSTPTATQLAQYDGSISRWEWNRRREPKIFVQVVKMSNRTKYGKHLPEFLLISPRHLLQPSFDPGARIFKARISAPADYPNTKPTPHLLTCGEASNPDPNSSLVPRDSLTVCPPSPDLTFAIFAVKEFSKSDF